MREIHRTIVAAIILSQDNKILLGKKIPPKAGWFGLEELTTIKQIPGSKEFFRKL